MDTYALLYSILFLDRKLHERSIEIWYVCANTLPNSQLLNSPFSVIFSENFDSGQLTTLGIRV